MFYYYKELDFEKIHSPLDNIHRKRDIEIKFYSKNIYTYIYASTLKQQKQVIL